MFILAQTSLTYPRLQALLASDMRDEDVLYILEKTFGTMVDTSRENYTGTFLLYSCQSLLFTALL